MEHVFYGDIFIIAQNGCLIMGHGKTKAGRIAAERIEDNEISLDFAHLFNNDEGAVIGKFSLPIDLQQMLNERGIKSKECPKIALNFALYCLDSDGTTGLFPEATKAELLEIDKAKFADIASWHIDFTDGIVAFDKIMPNFGLRYFLVPWCSSHEEKGILIRNSIKRITTK